MIINHNMNALNAHRNMMGNIATAGKSMEKLSSGLRINRAGDDAAGLAISEKMRGQIRGLDQASRNAQDGISLIQTAEGALAETHSILQRMRELSVQSANDTNVAVDRTAIQDEINSLTEEINRISGDTEFNTQKLLDGGFKGEFQIGANSNQTVKLDIGNMSAASLGLTTTNSLESKALTKDSNLADGTYKISGKNLVDTNGNSVGTFDAASKKITVNGKDTVFDKAALAENAVLTVKSGTAEIKNTMTGAATKLSSGNYEIKGTNVIKDGKLAGTFDAAKKKLTIDGVGDVSEAELGFQTSKMLDKVSFTINGSDVSTRELASGSIKTINSAIEQVSTQRSKLGAVQNRLEHTINNLNTSSENLTAAESRVRDVDMAKEMMAFSKNNILSQAAQAMLGQANQQPQGVLQLLR
ncbi:flagellin [Clostridium chauvoei]|uniref:Flagellin n=9 Tax=Clostridium chauvoei TaxID=46867 RepID=A0A1U6J5H5_9CLOT|nr:flagellin [Clostridium chauvoei]ATD57694.1 flagellin [Clostridium chauvoei]QBJ74911.1 flagellin [Clostridium chauvoei]SLK15427.1 Putative Flagellin protein FliB [Clostridium chauvoei JF4335]BAB13814.1 flagellin [Clostridium chauvoei]BAB87726.1 flagellin protein FliA(C) [Clostridium chauvoei]